MDREREMRQYLHQYASGSKRFHKPVRNTAGLSGMIHRTEDGLLIELSDGRMRSMYYDAFGPRTDAMNAAVQWAMRNGATSVGISD